VGQSIFVRSIDSNELEARFSTEDRLQYFMPSKYSLEDIKPYLAMLPTKEHDLIMMYYVMRKDQKEIAKILNLSQGGVSHRIARARERLKFLISIPKFTRNDLFDDLKLIIEEEVDLIIMWELYRTTCQSQVAELVNMTQSRVRHRFMKCLKILEEKTGDNEKMKVYLEAFKQISTNFNILHEISLPKWAHKNKDYKDIRVPAKKTKKKVRK
jgi:predicted DNA-binding protein YlxM (UPF0122 family)